MKSSSGKALTNRQKVFLTSDKPLGMNKTQYEKDILGKLEKSISILEQILVDTHNLKKEKIYAIINARTLEPIISNLLKDVEKLTSYEWKKYDFRTVEIARLLFETSANYLRQSLYFGENEAIENDIKRVSDHFVSLARFGLEKETNLILDREEERVLLVECAETAIKIRELKNNPSSDVHQIDQKLKESKKRLIELDDEVHNLSDRESKSKNREKYSKTKKMIEDLTKKESTLLEPLRSKFLENRKKIEQKYSHLFNISCPINQLPEFSELLNDQAHNQTR